MWTTPTAEAPPALNPRPARGLNLRLVLHAIWRHPLALCGVLVFAATVGAGIWLFLPLPKKTAAVVFQIAHQQPSILAPMGPDSRTEFGVYRQSQVALVKLRGTLNAALNDPKLRNLNTLQKAEPDPLTWLERNVSVDSRSGPEYMRITVEGDDEQELLALIGAVSTAYQAAVTAVDVGTRSKHLETLEKQLRETQGELEGFQSEIDRIGEELGATDPETLLRLQSILGRELEDALAEHDRHRRAGAAAEELLTEAKNRMAAHKARKAAKDRVPEALAAVAGVAYHGKWPRPDVPNGVLELAFMSDPVLQKLEATVSLARAELARTVNKYEENRTPVPEEIVVARKRLTTAETQRDDRKSEIRTAVEARQELLEQDRLAQAEAAAEKALREADLLKNGAQKKMEAIWNRIKAHGKKKTQLGKLQRDSAQKVLVRDELLRNIERHKVEVKAQSRVSLLEPPFVVRGLEGNRRMTVALVATVATFFLGFAGVVFWEFRSRRATHADELSTDLGTRLIGTIPPLAPAGPTPTAAHSDLIEAIDTTRIMLTHGSPLGDDVRVLVVTSAVSGEGKTTLSGNLAISLTRAGFKTLLIDGDTRAPTAHTLFNLAETPGLGELLREEADVAAAVRSSPIPGLSVLPAGSWTPATHQMLAGSRWRQLKRELKEEFDFVVIDTSPLLLVSDTMLLAREADGVVLSVLLGVSQISRVSETVERLNAVGAKLAGVVVNNVRSSAAQHADAYRAKYYARSTAALLPHTGLVEQTASPTENG